MADNKRFKEFKGITFKGREIREKNAIRKREIEREFNINKKRSFKYFDKDTIKTWIEKVEECVLERNTTKRLFVFGYINADNGKIAAMIFAKKVSSGQVRWFPEYYKSDPSHWENTEDFIDTTIASYEVDPFLPVTPNTFQKLIKFEKEGKDITTINYEPYLLAPSLVCSLDIQ